MPRPATGSTSPDALDLAPGIPPWEHQPGETSEAFHRFEQYLQVDPLVRSKRSMAVVHDLLTTRDPHMCSVGALQNMATLNHWHTRAAAYDRWKRQQRDIAAAKAEREWAETIARRRAEVQLKHLDVAEELIDSGLRALAMRNPDDISDAAAVRMIDLGYRMRRETLHLDQRPDSTPDTGHVDGLDDEQTAARMRQLADELARRLNNKPTAAAAAHDDEDVLDAVVIPDPRDSSDHDDLDTWPDPGPPRAIGPAEPG